MEQYCQILETDYTPWESSAGVLFVMLTAEVVSMPCAKILVCYPSRSYNWVVSLKQVIQLIINSPTY